jgi:hypothetical protein
MRRFRVYLYCWLFAFGLTQGLALAASGRPRVVLLAPNGPRAWPAAERRMEAELTELGVDVLAVRDRANNDSSLRRYSAQYGAIAAVQILRRGNDGIIRVWLRDGEGDSGEFVQRSVNLRSGDVVNLAVLPITEAVYGKAQPIIAAGPNVHRYEPPPQGGVYHFRSEMRYAARVGVGPWFSGADTTPAVNTVLGVRAHWFGALAFQAEGLVHSLAHRVETSRGVGELRLWGARGYALYEPFPRSSVSLGFGPGVGVFWAVPRFLRTGAETHMGSFLSFRGELASPLVPFVDVVFVFGINYAMSKVPSDSLRDEGAPLMRTGLDSMVAVDWHWE